jgi:hypothetical protein
MAGEESHRQRARKGYEPEDRPYEHEPDIARQLALAIVASTQQQQPSTMIGRGNFGCLYSPPLRCARGELWHLQGRSDVASKLAVMDGDFETERRVLQLLEEIDPAHLYHVPYQLRDFIEQSFA